MNDPALLDQVLWAQRLSGLLSAGAIVSFALTVLSGVPLLVFVVSRLRSMRDPGFERRPSAPAHEALLFFAAVVWGIHLPCVLLVGLNSGDAVHPWRFPALLRSPLVTVPGGLCIGWLLAHVIEAALRPGRLHISGGAVDRAMSALALALSLTLSVAVTAAALASPHALLAPVAADSPSAVWIMGCLFPAIPFAGNLTLAAALAHDAWRRRRPTVSRWRWAVATPLAALTTGAVFSPLLMTHVHVSEARAREVVAENRLLIEKAALRCALDPRLLAGVVYAGQVTHRPRWGGELRDAIVAANWANSGGVLGLDLPFGIAQVRAGEMLYTTVLLRKYLQPPAPTTTWAATPPGFRLMKVSMYSVFLPWEYAMSFQSRLRALGTSVAPPLLPPQSGEILTRLIVQGSGGAWDTVLHREEMRLFFTAATLATHRHRWRDRDVSDAELATLLEQGYLGAAPPDLPDVSAFGRLAAEYAESDECARLFPMTSREVSGAP